MSEYILRRTNTHNSPSQSGLPCSGAGGDPAQPQLSSHLAELGGTVSSHLVGLQITSSLRAAMGLQTTPSQGVSPHCPCPRRVEEDRKAGNERVRLTEMVCPCPVGEECAVTLCLCFTLQKPTEISNKLHQCSPGQVWFAHRSVVSWRRCQAVSSVFAHFP